MKGQPTDTSLLKIYIVDGLHLHERSTGFIFSIAGNAGGVLEIREIFGAALIIIGALGFLISISRFGVFTFIRFLVGGILLGSREQARRTIVSIT